MNPMILLAALAALSIIVIAVGVAMSGGSAGRALAFAELDLAKLEDRALAILRQGDPTNARRSELAVDLGKKAAAERYAAFLDLAPTLIAREARTLEAAHRERALDAYDKARELAMMAPRLSLDPAATVFQIGLPSVFTFSPGTSIVSTSTPSLCRSDRNALTRRHRSRGAA